MKDKMTNMLLRCVEIRLDGRNYQVRLDDEKK